MMNAIASLVQEVELTADDRVHSIISALEKQFERGAVMLPDTEPQQIDVIRTGISTIDRATGIGGIPRGRVTEIYGVESSGKSSLTLHIIAEAQAGGLAAAYLDVEHSLDTSYAKEIGVDLSQLLISQPDNAEQALEIVEALVRTGEVGCIVIDSVAALVPSAEVEGTMEQQFVGLQARLIGKALRKLTGVTAKSNTALIFVNQLRMTVGGYGNPEITPGGKALKYYSSLRLELRKGETINVGQEATGIRVKVKVVKNKLASPYRTTEATCYFGKGFSQTESLADVAIELGIATRKGAWVKYNEQTYQGKAGFLRALEEDSELRAEVSQAIEEA